LALELARAGRERELRPAAGAGKGLYVRRRGGVRHRTHCGIGGGAFAKSGASSGTSPAFIHCAIPAFHTSELRLNWPEPTWPWSAARSNGPVWLWPTATWNIATPGIGGGAAPAVAAAAPVIALIMVAPIATPAPSPMAAPAIPPGFAAAS